jgi:hypothetical protein
MDLRANRPARVLQHNSLRTVVTITGGSLGRVRATFLGGSTSLVVAHAAVGVWTGSNTDTTATPVELKFSGAFGFTLASNASIVSDQGTLAFTGSNKLVLILDVTSGDMVKNSSATNSYSRERCAFLQPSPLPTVRNHPSPSGCHPLSGSSRKERHSSRLSL